MASIIKADNIQKVSDGTNIIKKCGSTTTIGSGASNPIVICGSTVTLGRCGGTVTLASGATQTGFGRTGTVDWCTTAKTAPFTGVSGKGYFVNTTCGAVTVTLPASPTAGDIVSLSDYASNWGTNNVTLCRNSSKINAQCSNGYLSTSGQSVTLIYVDGTRGWKTVQDSTADITGASYITATGGTITTCGDYKIHTFTADGTFCISSGGGPLAKLDYVVVAGGGGSAYDRGGGGGAGGFRESHTGPVSGCYATSPLASTTSLGPFSPGGIPVTVGAGGAADNTPPVGDGANGSNSVFSTITSAGGGGGGHNPATLGVGADGGSGGGAGTVGPVVGLRCGGAGNVPNVSPPQGNPGGGNGFNPGGPPWGYTTGGGGGATAAGGQGNPGGCGDTNAPGGAGGTGATTSITGSATSYSGGGGGGTDAPDTYKGLGGTGGGGNGSGPNGSGGASGTANTGGGGGGSSGSGTGVCGGSGGSGIVIIRYKFQ